MASKLVEAIMNMKGPSGEVFIEQVLKNLPFSKDNLMKQIETYNPEQLGEFLALFSVHPLMTNEQRQELIALGLSESLARSVEDFFEGLQRTGRFRTFYLDMGRNCAGQIADFIYQSIGIDAKVVSKAQFEAENLTDEPQSESDEAEPEIIKEYTE